MNVKEKKIKNFNRTLHTRQHSHEQPTDKLLEHENEGEPKHRYSISEVITQIKRSIPDLRSIKHQPLENSGKFVTFRYFSFDTLNMNDKKTGFYF